MSVPDVRDSITTPTIPRPRTGESIPAVEAEPPAPQAAAVEQAAPALPPARYPWPEPWGSARGARPRTEYWDVATASWRSRGPRSDV